MNIPFSPPDMSEAEIQEVAEALRSGWITTGPKTKEFERLISMCCQTVRNDDEGKQRPTVACLNSATACMELAMRVLGIGEGDEVFDQGAKAAAPDVPEAETQVFAAALAQELKREDGQ